jgi:hypothetical protein
MTAEHPLAGAGSRGGSVENADEVRRIYSAKALAEIACADLLAPGSDAVQARGNPLARVLVFKGMPGPAEASGGSAMSGADGEAITKALVALGYRDDDAFFVLTRPDSSISKQQRDARVAALVEAVDPIVVVALDAEAADDLSAAVGQRVAPSAPLDVGGRRLVAVDEFEASLTNQARKRVVWRQLQAAAPPGPIY